MAVFATFQNIVIGGLPFAFSSYPLNVVFRRGYAKQRNGWGSEYVNLSLPQTQVARLRQEHLLRYLCALPTIRVHPELDGRTLHIVHSLKGVTMSANTECEDSKTKLLFVLSNEPSECVFQFQHLNLTQECPSPSSFLRAILIFVRRYDVKRSSCKLEAFVSPTDTRHP